MHQRLNHEGHDESQYLPRGTPPVNAHRAKQNGIKYYGTAIKVISWLPDVLFDRRIIEKDHLDTIVSFNYCYLQTLQDLGYNIINGVLKDVSTVTGTREPVDMFISVLTKLPKPESNMMLWIVCDDRNRCNVDLAHKLVGTIKHAAENTQKIFDDINTARKTC